MNRQVIDVPADGQCMFYAVAAGMLGGKKRGYKTLADKLRKATVKILEREWSKAKDEPDQVAARLSEYSHHLEIQGRPKKAKEVDALAKDVEKHMNKAVALVNMYHKELRDRCSWSGPMEVDALLKLLMAEYDGYRGIRVFDEATRKPIPMLTFTSNRSGKTIDLTHNGTHFKWLVPRPKKPAGPRKSWDGVYALQEPVETARACEEDLLSSNDIEAVLNKLKRPGVCVSVMPTCRVKAYDYSCMVVNNNRGHWVAMVVDKADKTVTYFDPYGRSISKETARRFKEVLQYCKDNGYSYRESEHRYQDDGTECGVWAIWFVAQIISTGKLIMPFTDGTSGTFLDMNTSKMVDKKGMRSLYFKATDENNT